METGKPIGKQILFVILVLIATVPFYLALKSKSYSFISSLGLGLAFFILGSGLGLLYGWIRWQGKGKNPSDRAKVVFSYALQYCFWLIPASVAIGILVNIMGLHLGSIGLGAILGFVFLFVVLWLKAALGMNVQAMREAQESRSTDYREYEDLDFDEEERTSGERPLGSVEDALKPKLAWGKECSICGKQHGITPGFASKWHECTQCGQIFCDNCGRDLDKRGGFLNAERCCSSCGGETRLI